MTEDDVRAAAERLVDFHERFAPLFGKEEAQLHGYIYVKGLMVCPERKSIEPIALNVGDGRVSALQKFVNIAPWDHEDVQVELQTVFAEELVPTAADDPVGVVGVIDESAFAKKGDQQRRRGPATQRPSGQGGQLPGRGLPGRGHPRRRRAVGSSALLARGLVRGHQAGSRRRAKVHIPESVGFQTKPQIAAGLIRPTVALGIVPLDWITADEDSWPQRRVPRRTGSDGAAVRGRGPGDDHGVDRGPGVVHPAVPRPWPRPHSPRPGVGRRGPRGRRGLGPARWQKLCVGQGAKGPLVYEFAAQRVWAMRHGEAGPPFWLLARRSLEATPEVKYYVSNARRDDVWECWRGWPVPGTGSRSSWRMARATWAWRSTRRGRGSAGTIT